MAYTEDQLNGADNAVTTIDHAGGYAAGVVNIDVVDSTDFPSTPFSAALGVGTNAYEEVIVINVAGNAWTLLNPTVYAHPHEELVENTVGSEVLARLVAFALQHTHTSGNDGAVVAHTALAAIGTNTHPQIDAHIASAGDPHTQYVLVAGDTMTGSLDVQDGTLRALAGTNTPPASGSGLELLTTGGNSYLQAYDRTGAAYLPLQINASALSLNAGGGGAVDAYGRVTANPGATTFDATNWGNTQALRAAHSTDTAGSESAAQIQLNITGDTSAAAGYQKNGLFVQAMTADPAVYPLTIERACVAMTSLGYIAAGNLTGRVWGANLLGYVQDTSDGVATGVEVDIVNYGTDQAAFDTSTTKIGAMVVGMGDQPVTAGLYLTSWAAAPFHYGIYCPQAAIGAASADRFINFGPGLFTVDKGGHIGVGVTTQAAALEVKDGAIRATDGTNTPPSAGTGLELLCTGAHGYINAYNRDGSAYVPLDIAASVAICTGTTSWTVNGPGLLVAGDPPATSARIGIGTTTGLGNGAATNLTALAKGTGGGPASMAVVGWYRVTFGTLTGWSPFFQ